MMNARILLVALIAVGFAACNDGQGGKSRGPIVLGDSATIVTETDPKALQDQVVDLNPVIKSEEQPAAEEAAPVKDTTTSTAATTSQPAQPTGNGLTVPFKEVTIFIPGITTRMYGKPDLQKAHGASYELTGGDLKGAQLRISGGMVSKVSQRYQTVLMLHDGNDKLVLESLPKATSDWQTLTGTGGAYPITGLEAAKLEYKLPAPAALRNAVQQAARKARLNRKDTQDWLEAARGLHSANQALGVVMLRSVMWRIEGKGFSKELRMDVPLP